MKKFLLVLISVDILFVILHILLKMDILENSGFRINRDGGFAEIYQYNKAVLSSIVLLIVAWKEKSGLTLFWSMLCFFLFLDDWLRLHERVGGNIFGAYLETTITNTYHQGQLLYATLFALIAGLIGIYFWRSSTPSARRLSVGLIASFGLLGFSAVIVDYMHAIWVPEHLDQLATIIEEAGEHLAISLILWFSVQGLLLTKEAHVYAPT